MDHSLVSGGIGLEIKIDGAAAGERLDKYIALQHPSISRSQIQRLIATGHIKIKGIDRITPGLKIKAGHLIEISIPPPEPISIEPSPIPIHIVYEDSYMLVIEKPPGLVVHPGAGREEKTLVHALLHHCKDLSGIGGKIRPGIVHRLDKDTSGLMVAAKNDLSHDALIEEFKAGLVKKTYTALVLGKMRDKAGWIDLPIGRHPVDRKKMSVAAKHGKQATTSWRLVETMGAASLLSIDIHTGRTHQIRVHMAHMGHPVIGDTLYGGPAVLKTGRKEPLPVPRQMLHASRLRLKHPVTGEDMEWLSDPPDDMADVINGCRALLD